MKIFMSGETHINAEGFREIRNSIEDQVAPALLSKDYGKELVDIAIIPIIIPKDILEKGFFKERKLFKRKRQEADMRLQIDFEIFYNASNEKNVY